VTVPPEAVRRAALVLSCTEGEYDEDDYRVAGDMLEAAAPAIRADQRKLDRQLASERGAVYLVRSKTPTGQAASYWPFADLLEDPQGGAA